MRTRIKFCGMTEPADAERAIAFGVDAVGAILAPSPRRVSLASATAIAEVVPAFVAFVVVLVDPSEAQLREVRAVLPHALLQFSGAESPARCRFVAGPYAKVIHLSEDGGPDELPAPDAWPDALLMFDTRSPLGGGSGRSFAWERVEPLARRRPIVVSGGLHPENVADCVRRIRPFAVDVRSGIETDGRKDAEKMRRFVERVREADAAT